MAGRKKARSAKQRANDKRLGRMARARGRSTPKPKRRKSAPRRKTNKPRSRRAPVARRKAAPRRSTGSKIPFINNPTVKKVAAGVGMATIVVGGLSLVAPSIAANPIVKPAVALLAGGPIAAIAQLFLGGGLGGGMATGGGGGNVGFA